MGKFSYYKVLALFLIIIGVSFLYPQAANAGFFSSLGNFFSNLLGNIAPALIVIGIIVAGGIGMVIAAQILMANAPSIAFTIAGAVLISAIGVAVGIVAADCFFGQLDENPIDPDWICQERAGGSSTNTIGPCVVDVRVDSRTKKASEGPVTVRGSESYPEHFAIRWAISGMDYPSYDTTSDTTPDGGEWVDESADSGEEFPELIGSCEAWGDWGGEITSAMGAADITANKKGEEYEYGIKCDKPSNNTTCSDSVIVNTFGDPVWRSKAKEVSMENGTNICDASTGTCGYWNIKEFQMKARVGQKIDLWIPSPITGIYTSEQIPGDKRQNGGYRWSVSPGDNGILTTGGGPETSVTFSSPGVKTVTVSSGWYAPDQIVPYAEYTGTIIVGNVPPPVSAPTCEFNPESLSEQIPGMPIEVEASGGDGGNYNWTLLTDGVLSSVVGDTVLATFNSPGLNTASVESGGLTGTCNIFLFNEPTEDACPNIPGNQVSVPKNMIVDEFGNCVEKVEEYEEVTCSPAQSQINIGDSITFTATGGDGDYNWSPTRLAFPNTPNNTATGNFDSPGSYTITVTSAGLSDICDVTVAQPLPDVRIWADPTEIVFPFDAPVPPVATYLIRWNSDNANSCTASGDWSGVLRADGSRTFTKEERGTYNYKITCKNSSGTAFDETSVVVKEIPQCDFYADPKSIILPQSSTLSWTCRYASSCTIDNGVGQVVLNPSSLGGSYTEGDVDVHPSKTTDFTLLCNGADGSNSFKTTVSIGFTPWLKEIIPIWK